MILSTPLELSPQVDDKIFWNLHQVYQFTGGKHEWIRKEHENVEVELRVDLIVQWKSQHHLKHVAEAVVNLTLNIGKYVRMVLNKKYYKKYVKQPPVNKELWILEQMQFLITLLIINRAYACSSHTGPIHNSADIWNDCK